MPIHPSKKGSHPGSTQNLLHPSASHPNRSTAGDSNTPLNRTGGQLGSDPGAAKISDGTGKSGIDMKTGFSGAAHQRLPAT